ncbi:hypothetical protein CRG98_030360 [Punica granatum]|uniref:Uncharacterized protein n=1 Tax=Punica granatum TaxID=22663 RepID=A0A2I0IZ25_PUNGR|nr:hypothetical protein CRG98_030360 [Punica granatum]
MANKCRKSNLLSLGIRGKSRGSVRESGDSVERLEGCSGAKDARSGKDGRGARYARACTGTAGGQERGKVLGRAAGGRARRRGAMRGYCSPDSTVFARNE